MSAVELHLVGGGSSAPDGALRPTLSPRRAIVAGGVAAVVMVAGLFGSSAAIDIAGAVVTNGAISPRGRPQAVQHLDGGIAREIRVRNGSTVAKGDLLILLDDSQLHAAVEIQRNRLREGLARRSRLIAERDRSAAIDWTPPADLSEVTIPTDLRVGQQRLFEIRRAARGGQASLSHEKVKQFNNQEQGLRGQIAAKTQQIESLDVELAKMRELQKDGYVSETRVLALDRERSALVGQVAEHRAELARMGNGIDEVRISGLQNEREFHENVLSELRQVNAEVNDTAQQYKATREQLARVEIRAPESGVVHELAVVTVGGVVPARATIMQLVPQTQDFVVDASLDPQFVDQVARGQSAVVRFPAFSRDTTPEVNGSVRTVSPTSVVDERTGAAFYRMEVQIPPEELTRLAGRQVLPGMPVEVYVQTGDRSILSYFLKPVRDQVQRAMREK